MYPVATQIDALKSRDNKLNHLFEGHKQQRILQMLRRLTRNAYCSRPLKHASDREGQSLQSLSSMPQEQDQVLRIGRVEWRLLAMRNSVVGMLAQD